MEGALHNKKIRENLGIPKEVAEEYVNADKRNNNWKKQDYAAKKAAIQLVLATVSHLYGRS
jgi:uncharacterized membrane protein